MNTSKECTPDVLPTQTIVSPTGKVLKVNVRGKKGLEVRKLFEQIAPILVDLFTGAGLFGCFAGFFLLIRTAFRKK